MNSNYETCRIEYKIHAEYQQLLKNKIPNVYVIPSASSSFIWYGVIFLHHGLYEGGIFRFTIFIPDNFDCPRVIFNPIVYHPMINSESGELDVRQYIKNWKLNMHHVYHVLFYVRRIFYQIETKDCLNKEAAKLFESDYDAFVSNVKKCVGDCNKKMYDNPPINADDPHAIRFTKLDNETLKQAKQSMMNSVDLNDTFNLSSCIENMRIEESNKNSRPCPK